jgi:hypothetical protein
MYPIKQTQQYLGRLIGRKTDAHKGTNPSAMETVIVLMKYSKPRGKCQLVQGI